MIERILDWLTKPMYWLLGPLIVFSNRALDRLPRPLDPFRSIKLKLGILLGISGATGLSVFYFSLGGIPWRTAISAAMVGVITLQVLAHGMTKPLREMTAAARSMARGDYSRRVRATSRDEVGTLARAFNLMAADLAANDQQRRELIANVSHELRTPITALQGVLENMVDGVSTADPATLRTALAQTQRLSRLVTELLDLSKVDAGAAALQRVPVPVAEFLATVVEEAGLNSPKTRFRLDGVVAHTISADPARLHQVFANLLENAARHSPPWGLVTVSARPEGATTVFEVLDQGIGIAPAHRERVFERFTTKVSRPGAMSPAADTDRRGSRPAQTARSDGGTGLGLAIARWAVELHHGTIAIVDPPAGVGCRVRITLPHGQR
ncbi:HAMP domain-containing sensor histidine kinase [Catellatospora sp. KI3]|uniref:sensor histidine kinase n=1 Tax=Catellatospora sp. KI3 TaxID=3041620 RepID=UPI002482AED8|nr:HAMP domain-containing sensor histidine kinase [Catellatospora sp. KI3]MDI1464239.1 HAMP domain-containing sensor histidine kinase [Catellatospora sp. KI3]